MLVELCRRSDVFSLSLLLSGFKVESPSRPSFCGLSPGSSRQKGIDLLQSIGVGERVCGSAVNVYGG